MGLDVSHNCFHGAYSAFMSFRLGLAKAALGREVQVKDLYGTFDYNTKPDEALWQALEKSYPNVTSQILNHSDCDGDIPIEFQIQLAEELEALAQIIPPSDMGSPHIEREGGLRSVTLQFASGLRRAHSNQEIVTFA